MFRGAPEQTSRTARGPRSTGGEELLERI